MIIYVENPERIHKKLQLINEFSKLTGYKINMPKLVVFLYTSNKQSKKEIKKTIPFIIASKRINT